jgi:hypothetical protein
LASPRHRRLPIWFSMHTKERAVASSGTGSRIFALGFCRSALFCSTWSGAVGKGWLSWTKSRAKLSFRFDLFRERD